MHLTTGSLARPQRLRTALVVATLAASLLLTGCSDDGDSPKDASTESSVPTSPGSVDPGIDFTATDLVRDAVDRLNAGQVEEAKELFEQAVLMEPENAFALYNLGYIAQTKGDDEEALDYYDRALEAKPKFVEALFNKAILLETSDLEQSVELYREALKIDEKMAAAHMRLGFALLHLGDKKGAERELGRGLELDPSMADFTAPTYE